MTAVLFKVYCYRGTDKQIWFEVEDTSTGQGIASICIFILPGRRWAGPGRHTPYPVAGAASADRPAPTETDP